MSNHHQRIRDELARGDEVIVSIKTRATQNPKRRNAVVRDIGRAAAVVRFEDGHECPIRFSDLEIVPKARKKEPPAARLPTHVAPPATAATAPPPSSLKSAPTPRQPMEIDSAQDLQASIAAFIEMGGELFEPLQLRIAQVDLSLDALRDERREIDVEIDARLEEKRLLSKQLEQLAPLTKMIEGMKTPAPKP